MRKLIPVVGCLSVFWTGWCFGQTNVLFNGTDWKSLESSARISYVSGFIEGYFAGTLESYKHTFHVIETSSLTPQQKIKLADRMVKEESVAGPAHGTTGQLEATVSTFYDDYRNMPVCWKDAVLLSALAVSGNAPTEQELNAARKKGAESGCK